MLASAELRILYAFLLLLAVGRTLTLQLREGQACPEMNNYPASTCTGTYSCRTLAKYLRSFRSNGIIVPSCGMSADMELICCPNQKAETSPTTAPPTRTPIRTLFVEPKVFVEPVTESVARPFLVNDLDSFGHIVAFRYFKDSFMDSYKYTCTGILISDSLVLTTNACRGEDVTMDPNKVVIGLKEGQHQFSAFSDIPRVHENDLVIFKMKDKLDTTKAPDAKIAEICTPNDIRNSQLFAVAFAQNQGENCGLFKQKMNILKKAACSYVSFQRGFEVIRRKHLCLIPEPEIGIYSQCANCLRGSASVLHLQRTDGSICVVGFATPTSNDCSVTDKNRPISSPLYYTYLLEAGVRNFINDKITNNTSGFRYDTIYVEKP